MHSLMIDRRRGKGQSVVGLGPHSHSFWEETDEDVGEPAPHRLTVSKICVRFMVIMIILN